MLENNAVAGCSHYGYWYRLLDEPVGLSLDTNPTYCPYKQPFGVFYNNHVHSSGRYGVWIYAQYAPTPSGEFNDSRPSQAIFEGLTAWRNDKGMEWVMSRTVQIKNAIVFDNANAGIACITAIDHQDFNPSYLRSTFYAENGSSVIDSIIIGDLGISSAPIIPVTAGLIGRETIFSESPRENKFSFISSNVGSWSLGSKRDLHQFSEQSNTSHLWTDHC